MKNEDREKIDRAIIEAVDVIFDYRDKGMVPIVLIFGEPAAHFTEAHVVSPSGLDPMIVLRGIVQLRDAKGE